MKIQNQHIPTAPLHLKPEIENQDQTISCAPVPLLFEYMILYHSLMGICLSSLIVIKSIIVVILSLFTQVLL